MSTDSLLQRGDPTRPLMVPRDGASRAALQDVVERWRSLREASQRATVGNAAEVVPPALAAAQAQVFVDAIDRLVNLIEAQLERWTTLMNLAQFAMMALVAAAAATLLYAAHRLVFSPLTRLQESLARVEQGDLSVRLDTNGGDEFASLASGFNRMAARLRDLYASLEQRVRDKTAHLETERARLASLYEAAAFVSSANSLEKLAQGFAAQTRRVARADAVAVRWSDERNRRYLLLASENLPAALIADERCIPTGQCACGQSPDNAATREFVLRDLRSAPAGRERPVEPDRRGQCAQAGFANIISVPVRSHERLVGEIDLFYRQAVPMDADDRALLDTLASHLAGGIEGLRADALQREAAVAEERGLLARELHDSIAQSLAFLKIQASLLRERLNPHHATSIGETLNELDQGILESLADVRELLLHFRTRTNEEDITTALRTTLTKFEHQTGLPTRLTVRGEGLPLPADVQIQVLHVVQEALSNVRKHAHARCAWIDVQQSPQWVFTVRDDGCGIEMERLAPDETHVGLRIMRERAHSVGATLTIDSRACVGTCVTLTMPMLAAESPVTLDTDD